MSRALSSALSSGLGVALGLLPVALIGAWIHGAGTRLAQAEASADDAPSVAVAQADERGYCTPQLKNVLRRVLTSCGLVGADGTATRGCQPANAKTVATMSGEDFNALFLPLAERAAIVEFDQSSEELDAGDVGLLDKVFAERGGASYFLVVSRSSPEGSVDFNRDLSERRGKAVLDHLQATFHDDELEREVGLLWLGEEYAQLDADFCGWNRSGDPADCSATELNRSAFLAWIDCRL